MHLGTYKAFHRQRTCVNHKKYSLKSSNGWTYFSKIPALLGAPNPIGPAETVGCGTAEGLVIHPAIDVDRGV